VPRAPAGTNLVMVGSRKITIQVRPGLRVEYRLRHALRLTASSFDPDSGTNVDSVSPGGFRYEIRLAAPVPYPSEVPGGESWEG